jgi:hydroxymethylpyrimidine/phosphomethylpyrimidine kinase
MTIAGSDSGGGAGIQADLKTFAAHRVHGLSAIAALTAQHTRGVRAVHVPPIEFLSAQIDACFEDFEVRSVKLGMLATRDVIATVADALTARRVQSEFALVLDPVMIATSGAKLLADDALDALRTRLLPMADVITPNFPEAEFLLGRTIPDLSAMHRACADLLALGAPAVLLKGGHLATNDDVIDLFAAKNNDGIFVREIRHPRLTVNAHGTGCTLAAAIAANLALERPLADACIVSSDYIHRALRGGIRPGESDVLVLDHFGAAD